MNAWVTLIALASLGSGAGVATAPADAAPAAEAPRTPRGRRIVYLMPVDGELPADTTDRRVFVQGVRSAFESAHFATERLPTQRSQGGPIPLSLPLGNRFQLVLGDPFGDEWQVSVTVMSWIRAGSADSLRGLRVNVAVLSPEAVAAGARPLPVREDLTLRVPFAPRAAWFSHAGRIVGLIAVEELHHQSGDLEPETRLRLDRTVRAPVVGRGSTTRRR